MLELKLSIRFQINFKICHQTSLVFGFTADLASAFRSVLGFAFRVQISHRIPD